MNYPPIFETCAADAGVVALLGESGGALRLYPAGSAPQGATKPYAVWQSVGGGPENYLGGRPDIDRFALQVDAYADTLSAARAIADAIEEAVELLAHVTASRGEEKDLETALYRVGFDLEWFVARAAPGPAPVSSEPPPASSSGGGLAAYPLDDDGAAAAAMGAGYAATNAPAHLRADYAYTGAAANDAALALPTLAAFYGAQGVSVAPGEVLAVEIVIHSGPAAFDGIGLWCVEHDGASVTADLGCAIGNSSGATPVYFGSGVTETARATATAGCRIGISVDGTTGALTMHTGEGDLASTSAYTPGRYLVFGLFVIDGPDGPDNTGNSCSVELVPNAAAMALAYPTGAVDVFGNVI